MITEDGKAQRVNRQSDQVASQIHQNYPPETFPSSPGIISGVAGMLTLHDGGFKCYLVPMLQNRKCSGRCLQVETLADAVYMGAGGVPEQTDDHAIRVARVALELRSCMQHYIKPRVSDGPLQPDIRIGMDVCRQCIKQTPQTNPVWGPTPKEWVLFCPLLILRLFNLLKLRKSGQPPCTSLSGPVEPSPAPNSSFTHQGQKQQHIKPRPRGKWVSSARM